jgi:hypothetical protein
MEIEMKTPQGFKDGPRLKISIALDPELFKAICKRCKATEKSFSSVANDLIKCGLLDIEESERDEPDYIPENMTLNA